MSPPRQPRNIFFPWANFVLIRSTSYLPPNSIAFRVPVSFTKFDIREYMRTIYGLKVIKANTYVRLGERRQVQSGRYVSVSRAYKKAILTCEETFPDEMRMTQLAIAEGNQANALDIQKMPMAHKGILDKNNTQTSRPGISRRLDWMPRHRYAWKEPLPMLLSVGGSGSLIKASKDSKDIQLERRTNLLLPHSHFSGKKVLASGVPNQRFPTVNWRKFRSSRDVVEDSNSQVNSPRSLSKLRHSK